MIDNDFIHDEIATECYLKLKDAIQSPDIQAFSVSVATLATAATIIGGISSVISMYNSFKRLDELREVNGKLDQLIGMTVQLAELVGNLDKAIAIEIKKSFIYDVQMELRGISSQFGVICKALNQEMEFPETNYNHMERLAELTLRAEVLTGKLSAYGPAAYHSVIANMLLVDSMHKILKTPLDLRQAYLMQHEETLFEHMEYFIDREHELLVANEVLQKMANEEEGKANKKIMGYPVCRIVGSISRGYGYADMCLGIHEIATRKNMTELRSLASKYQENYQAAEHSEKLYSDMIDCVSGIPDYSAAK